MRQILSFMLLAMLLLVSCALFAQETTGVISGTVTDSSGAVVPGATITITNNDRNSVIRTLKTGPNGEYTAPVLPIGNYGVRVEASGFKTYDKTGVVLNVNDRLIINAKLQLGGHQEEVNVQADALQVQTQDATAAGLINGTQVRELSLRSRNYEELVRLMPGVTTDLASDTLYMGVSAPGGGTNEVDFSINGSLSGQNNWTVDGADNVDRGGNYTLLNYPSVDAIAEFKVLRGNYNPEFGRAAGGQINVITRSGTSTFHGGVYEFFRNDALDANNWLNKSTSPIVPRAPFRYNDFGGTIGGPIYIPGHYNTEKNKTFFFFSEEVRRVIESDPALALVPTQLERAGNFSQSCFSYDSGGNCVAGPVLTSADITPAAQAYLKDLYQLSPGSNPKGIALPQVGNNLVTDTHNTFNYRQEIARIDHSFNQKYQIFARYMNDNIPTIEDGGLFDGNPFPNVTTTSTNSPGRSVIVTATQAFAPTLVNDISYSYSYGAVISRNIGLLPYSASPDVAAIYQASGILPYPTTLNRIPNLGFSDESGVYGFGDYNDFNRNHSVMDNLTKVWGRHTLKFGVQAHWYQKHENAAGPNTGSFNFSGDTLASEWYNFLTGNPDSYQQASADVDAVIRQHVIEAYAQDEWRVTPRFTLSYGVRYSRFGSPYDQQGKATNFVPALYNPAHAPTIGYDGNLCLPTACDGAPPAGSGLPVVTPNPNYDPYNGMIGPGVPGHKSPYDQQVSSTPNYFAPRVGFAYDPFGDGKTSIRAGYGMFVDSVAVNVVENNIFTNPPYSINTTFSGTNSGGPATLDNPNAGGSTNIPPAVGGLAENWHQPYVQQWSFDIQHEMPHGFLIDIGYYGSKGTHLFNYVNVNQPAPGAYVNNPAYAAAAKASYASSNGIPASSVLQVPQSQAGDNLLNLVLPFQGYNTIDLYEPTFKSNYHSLQTSLQKHFHGGNLISANYTWSKALSNLHFPAEYSVPQITGNIAQDYSETRYSRDHVFNLNFVYELPWYAHEQGFAGHVLGGWEFSGIVQVESGGWVNPGTTNTNDPSGVGIQFNAGAQTGSAALPNQVGNPNSGAPHNATQWFNTGAFADVPSCDPTQATPCIYSYGNARLGSILGPGVQTWDLSLFKNINFTERLNMQFRLEGFNVFNHTSFSGIDTVLGDSNYGAVTAAHDPRILQLGLKLNF
ncbi:MAG TPA: TonB-dependent receptor [Candidatus Koribacter sp.]